MVEKCLFLIEKYCDADPACGPTGAEHQVVGAVMSTELVSLGKRFYFDVLSKAVGKERMGRLLLEECELYQPDLIIYTPLGGDLGRRLNPSHEVMQTIMHKLGMKVFLNLWDAPEHGLEEQWLPSATLLGVDSLVWAYRNYRHLPNVIFVHSTVDPTIHFNKGLRRAIDVSFVGSVDPADRRWPLRHEYTSFLGEKGINILVAGGQRGSGRIPIEKCSDILNQSKISLDFCMGTDGQATMHLRAFEVTSCGALLMVDWNTLLAELFEPGKDLIIFHSKEELLDLVKYYLRHQGEREAIAVSGWQKATKLYNARNMWGYIFERMGFEIPEPLRKNPNYLRHKEVIEEI